MQIYFTGRLLDASALMSEQAPVETQHALPAAAASAIPTDPCAWQPGDPCIGGAPTDHDLAAAAQWHAGLELQRHDLMRDIAQPASRAVTGSVAREQVSLWNLVVDDVANLNSTARDQVSLKNLVVSDVRDGARRWARDRVLPFSPSDYIGGVGSYPIEADRMRAPLFVQGAGDADEVSINDVRQQGIGDCYFLGPLAAVARHDPQRIKDMIVDHGDGTYTVKFKERVAYTQPPQYTERHVTVTGDWPGGLNGTGHAAGADVTKQGTVEIWPLVLEKAFGQYLSTPNPYGALDAVGSFDMAKVAIEAITGRPVQADGEWDLSQMGVSNPVYLGPAAKDFDDLLEDFQAGKAIAICTNKLPVQPGGMLPSHCYAVTNVYEDAGGTRWVELYNPHGTNHPPPIRFEELERHKMLTA